MTVIQTQMQYNNINQYTLGRVCELAVHEFPLPSRFLAIKNSRPSAAHSLGSMAGLMAGLSPAVSSYIYVNSGSSGGRRSRWQQPGAAAAAAVQRQRLPLLLMLCLAVGYWAGCQHSRVLPYPVDMVSRLCVDKGLLGVGLACEPVAARCCERSPGLTCCLHN